MDNIMKRYRDRIIPIEKFELSHFDSFSQGFPLINKWFDITLQNGRNQHAKIQAPTREHLSYFSVPKESPIGYILGDSSLSQLSLSHSTPHGSKSLHSQLKEVKVYKLDSSWQLMSFDGCFGKSYVPLSSRPFTVAILNHPAHSRVLSETCLWELVKS
ncbi:hypothetical protein H5410_045252 [Solanum commersonii]|uniref:Uncharacterized protein n=1 Tax=Solanum commersonii TaxID=4109 RepID=A0A9J5XAJ9_SOLCO|nr:hypothetical protein H5410_045252 [Solanum commersonii]